MPHDITINMLPAGRSMNYARAGENISVQTAAFLTSDDGSDFTQFVEGLSGDFPTVIGSQGLVRESQVDHVLAVFHPDRTVRLYCNELQLISEIRAKRKVSQGEPVSKNDIADITRLRLETRDGKPVDIPRTCGVEFLFSVGWRKGLYFDFGPLSPEGAERQDDLELTFGHVYGRVLFHEFYSMEETEWDQLFEWGLFPFAFLSTGNRATLLQHAKYAHLPDELVLSICDDVRLRIADRFESWSKCPVLAPHMDFLRIAAERFVAKDLVSSIQVLYPRIEGVLRACLSLAKPGSNANQGNLARHAGMSTPEQSLLLPRRFERFLQRFYFRNFDVPTGSLPLSRHTIAHGVSSTKDYDDIKASIGFLILDQIFYYSVST